MYIFYGLIKLCLTFKKKSLESFFLFYNYYVNMNDFGFTLYDISGSLFYRHHFHIILKHLYIIHNII